MCSGVVLQVLFIPKQLMLVTAGDDADVRVWDLVNKSCVAVLKVCICLRLLALMLTQTQALILTWMQSPVCGIFLCMRINLGLCVHY